MGEDGRVLLKCFANCEKEAIVEELGLTMADLFESRNGHKGERGLIPPRKQTQPCNHATWRTMPKRRGCQSSI